MMAADDPADFLPYLLPFRDGVQRIDVTELLSGVQHSLHTGFPEFLLTADKTARAVKKLDVFIIQSWFISLSIS